MDNYIRTILTKYELTLSFLRVRELINYLPLSNKDQAPIIKSDDPAYVSFFIFIIKCDLL